MITRMLVQTTAWLAVMASILFLGAGDWRWSEAWLYLAEVALLTLALSFWLLIHDPALLASRMTSPVRRDQAPWDRMFMTLFLAVFVGWLALIGADARRFGWSDMPAWAEGVGAAFLALGMAIIWRTFRYNTFAAPQVSIQADREHHVITDGPYRIVRHPMYAGAILWLLGAPLMLGSWWGVAAVPLIAAALGWRAVGEERMLRRELTGYDDYAKRVQVSDDPRRLVNTSLPFGRTRRSQSAGDEQPRPKPCAAEGMEAMSRPGRRDQMFFPAQAAPLCRRVESRPKGGFRPS